MLWNIIAWSATNDTFKRSTIEGVLLTYMVTNETNKECMVGTNTTSLGLACETSTTGAVTIPSTVNGYTVTSIGYGAFDQCRISSISIPNTVKTIYGRAFNDCSNLESIYIPVSVTNIAEGSGSGGAFSPEYLTNIVVAEGNSNYDSRNNCNAIIKTSTKKLIYGCDNTIIPNDIKQIGTWAFADCKGLKNITIPSGVWKIGESAFRRATNLVSITIPETVTTIDSYAFDGCSQLVNIDIPQSITSLGTGVFNGTEWENNLPEGLMYIGKLAYKYIGTMPENTSIVIKDGTTRICGNAFMWGNNLISISIPESVTSIGEYAFMYCGKLSSITLPSNITTIEEGAFWSCYNLSSVFVERKTPINIYNVFSNVEQKTLYVPYGTKASYESAYIWKDFKIIKEMKDDITISSNGIATYSSTNDLDFTDVAGLKAYIASGFSPSTGELTLTRVYKVPAGEGLLLKGDAGDYEIPYATTDMVYSNLLKGVTTPTELSPTDGTYTNFILANGSHGIGFYTLSASGNIAANKAYLQILTSDLTSPAASLTLVFNDEANNETEMTGIDSHKVDQNNNNVYYNLRGQAVSNPKKGLYIFNNKKVLIK